MYGTYSLSVIDSSLLTSANVSSAQYASGITAAQYAAGITAAHQMYAVYSESVSNSSPYGGSLHQECIERCWSVFLIFCRCCIFELVKKNKHGLCVLRLELMFSRSRFPGTLA